ncbi:MAG: conserved rane protein of unknown function [Chitinophagaceae bacterium]|nr:conserved rane protein of unknown function [Chitinophagaceae bacterium]
MICDNCHHRFKGNFCSHCGKKSDVDRFDMRSIWEEGYTFAKSIVVLFFQTVYRLTVHAPQHLKTFLFKDREFLLPSIEYLLFSGTVVSILTFKFNFFQTGYSQFEPGIHLTFISDASITYLNQFFAYTEQYSSLTNILAIPCFTICSYLIFYKEHYSLGEHLIINTYIAAQQALFLLLLSLLLLWNPSWKALLIDNYIGASIVYNFWVYYGMFAGKKINTALNAALCLFLAYILSFVFNLCIYSLLLPYRALIDPFI